MSQTIPTKLYKTKTGNFYLPTNTPNCVICIEIQRDLVYDPAVFNAVMEYLRPGSVVIDLGACFGQMSVLWAKELKESGGWVYAVEADKPVFDILVQNIQANECHNIWPLHRAAWHVSDQQLVFPEPTIDPHSTIPTPAITYGSWRIDPGATVGPRVQSLVIDKLGLDNVSIIKSDLQGADLLALYGCRDTLKRTDAHVVFEIEHNSKEVFGTSKQDYLDFLESIGYEVIKKIGSNNYLAGPRKGS